MERITLNPDEMERAASVLRSAADRLADSCLRVCAAADRCAAPSEVASWIVPHARNITARINELIATLRADIDELQTRTTVARTDQQLVTMAGASADTIAPAGSLAADPVHVAALILVHTLLLQLIAATIVAGGGASPGSSAVASTGAFSDAGRLGGGGPPLAGVTTIGGSGPVTAGPTTFIGSGATLGGGGTVSPTVRALSGLDGPILGNPFGYGPNDENSQANIVARDLQMAELIGPINNGPSGGYQSGPDMENQAVVLDAIARLATAELKARNADLAVQFPGLEQPESHYS